jgi:hypothetical protein
MKLQINTDNKTITIEESVNLGELYEALFKMFPKFTWKEYSIVPVKSIEHWTSPVTIPWTPQPVLPWYNPTIVPLSNPGTTSPGIPSLPYTITCGNTVGFANAAGNITTTKLDNKNVTYTNGVYNVIINNDEGK